VTLCHEVMLGQLWATSKKLHQIAARVSFSMETSFELPAWRALILTNAIRFTFSCSKRRSGADLLRLNLQISGFSSFTPSHSAQSLAP
jgi:hypothetical protein